MKSIILGLLLVVFSLNLVNGSVQAFHKITELRALATQSKDEGIITLNITGYKYYILESPRPYDLVVFYTANDCKLCDMIYDELKTVARMYRQANAQSPVRTEGSKQRAVFFAKLTFTQESRDVFVDMNFKSVPNLIVTQPKISQVDEIQRPIYARDFTWQISPTDGQVTSSKILEFVNKRTHRNIEYREPIANMFIILAFIIAVGFAGYKLFFMFKSFFLNEKFWFTGSLIIYAICMAGVVYNIIHDVPFTNIDRNGNFEWFHSGSRSQFGAEGFVMSFLIAFIGLLLILLQKFIKLSANENTVRIGSLVAIFLIYYMVGFVEETYRKKSWYGPSFWPPDHYIRGPLMRDQGNNI